MLRYFPPERRRRFAPVFLVLGLVIVGKLAHDEMPRDQELTFVLPASVETLRVTYRAGDEEIAGLERRFPNGPPAFVSHTPSLSPGRYQLLVELLNQDGGVTRLERSIQVPSDGDLRVSLRGER